MKKRNPKSIKSRENIIFYIMNHKLKIVEDFLNSLESEQLKANQDTMLISGSYENQSGEIGTNASRCVNGTTACIGSINDRRCSNGVCDYTINGKKCTTVNVPTPAPTPTPTPATGGSI